ncbi:hypothetical protein CN514_21305 [Bacillus sp. AFS001701]|uniref:heparinase II/III family protein n=1 Tax=Bacillus sp. AFS001701 TaxID=2033480 RepID=UPI000BF9DF36|nr:alginate lyase family protein [Bacillus sp. AFS001701]PET44978.1 hypothetical protein CN514_21305 [Bacillus sp. AFS001701]
MNTSAIQQRKKIEIFRLTPALKMDQLKDRCDDILNNIIYFNKKYPPVKMDLNNLWSMDPYDRSWRFGLHSLKVLEYLLDGYSTFSDERYLSKAIELLWDWEKYNFLESQSEMAWHDHSTALRLIIICKIFESWKLNFCDLKGINRFVSLVEGHWEKLVDPEFYMERHNHGMDQDIALLVSTVVFNDLPKAYEWRQIATKRLEKQLEHLFGEDGSYFEHSPDYIYLLVERLFNVLRFINDNDIKQNSDLEEILNKSLVFLTFILQPDGQVCPIGDSEMNHVTLDKLGSDSNDMLKYLNYVVSGGKSGEEPTELDAIFPNGGYAALRNKWEYDKDTIQAIFLSSFHSRTHKHHDDLSFTIFGHGQPLLVDSGKYNYVYNSPERKYVVSTKAHNTVVVDNENTVISRNNIGKSGLTSSYLDKNFSFVSGTHCLYPGVIHQRLFLYLKPYDFIIIDYLQGYKIHSFEQNFHLAPSVNCINENNNITGYINEKPIISLRQLHKKNDTTINLVKGVKDPLIGWVSPRYSIFEPTFCASYRQNGSEGHFATQVSLNPLNELNVKLSWEDDILNITWENNSLKIIIATHKIYLFLNDKFLNLNYIEHSKIKEAIIEQRNYEYREKYRSERNRRLRYFEELETLKKELEK